MRMGFIFSVTLLGTSAPALAANLFAESGLPAQVEAAKGAYHCKVASEGRDADGRFRDYQCQRVEIEVLDALAPRGTQTPPQDPPRRDFLYRWVKNPDGSYKLVKAPIPHAPPTPVTPPRHRSMRYGNRGTGYNVRNYVYVDIHGAATKGSPSFGVAGGHISEPDWQRREFRIEASRIATTKSNRAEYGGDANVDKFKIGYTYEDKNHYTAYEVPWRYHLHAQRNERLGIDSDFVAELGVGNQWDNPWWGGRERRPYFKIYGHLGAGVHKLRGHDVSGRFYIGGGVGWRIPLGEVIDLETDYRIDLNLLKGGGMETFSQTIEPRLVFKLGRSWDAIASYRNEFVSTEGTGRPQRDQEFLLTFRIRF